MALLPLWSILLLPVVVGADMVHLEQMLPVVVVPAEY
jgi:hypothetical protein